MGKSRIIKINAPREIILELRNRFPNISDSNLIRITYNSSLMKFESKLRSPKVEEFLYGKKKKL